LDTLIFAAGILQSFERERGVDNMTFTPSVWLSEMKLNTENLVFPITLYWAMRE
jgi:hypothetical protein